MVIGILSRTYRRRRVIGLGIVSVMVLATSLAVYWAKLAPEVPEPSRPDYVEAERADYDYCPDLSLHEADCYDVITWTKKEGSLTNITNEISHGAPYVIVDFYYRNHSHFFARGCLYEGDTVFIAYNPDDCS
jgi:hypothetical protein